MALTPLGVPESFARTTEAAPGWWLKRGDASVNVFVYCDGDGFVDGIELANRPPDRPPEDEVLLRGVDVFGPPVLQVISYLRGLKLHVVEGADGFAVPDLALAFWRDSDVEDDLGEMPWFGSVLVTTRAEAQRWR